MQEKNFHSKDVPFAMVVGAGERLISVKPEHIRVLRTNAKNIL